MVVREVISGKRLRPIQDMTRWKDNRPYIRIKIFGVPFLGLLDSGASLSAIDGNCWQKFASLGLTLREEHGIKVSTANREKVEILGSVELPVELQDKICLMKFLIIPSLTSSMILGMDFWRKMRILPGIEMEKEGVLQDDLPEDGNISSMLVGKDNLSHEEREQLTKLVNKWNQRRVKTLGCTSKVQHVVDTGNHRPIKQRYYPVSPYIQKILNAELDEMLTEGIVVPSKSAWASPVVLVKKPDGSHRFCVDYRQVNNVTKRDAYPLPYISSILDRLRDAKFLSSLDIKSAYWQVPVEETSQEKTAFTVPGRGLFQFTRMPFGLHNSPATWQRLIDNVLGAELEPHVFVYLDDVVIVTSDFSEHLRVLEEVFERLAGANLSLNWDKCQFCRPELRFLGYVVNEAGLLVDPEKVESIRSYPTPTTVKQVRQFVGLASWYRRFVEKFSTIISPLTALLKKGCKFKWGEEQEQAMQYLKERLVSAPILSCPDFEKHFYLQTDASNTGLGAVLYQKYEEGDKVIAYASRSLTPAERKYSTTEHECLAVLWAVERFRPYLEGMPFTVLTDHQSLKWLHNLKDPQGRLARWAIKLQQYQFSIEHRSGKLNVAADALSRIHENVVGTMELSFDDLDPWYVKMVERIKSEPAKYPNWRVEGVQLFKRIVDRRKILGEECPWKAVVPKSKRRDLLFDCHDHPMSGHLGGFKTLQRLREHYYWPGMASDTARYVGRCETCLAHKPLQRAPAGLMGQQRIATRPWQLVSADIMGPLPLSSNQNRFIIAFSDYFSKYSVFVPVRSATAKAVSTVLEKEVVLMFGAPQTVICDNGPQFKSREFKAKAAEYHIEITYTPHYHPQANPMERPNRVIKTLISSYVKENQRRWDKELTKLAFAIKTAVHEVTGYSPAYINFGRELARSGKEHLNFDEDQNGNSIDHRREYVERLENMPLLYKEVQDKLARAYESSSVTYNLRRRPQEFHVGETVWRRNNQLSDATTYFNRKLAPGFVKCVVTKRIGNLLYQLKDMDGRDVGKWHVKDIKPHPQEL